MSKMYGFETLVKLSDSLIWISRGKIVNDAYNLESELSKDINLKNAHLCPPGLAPHLAYNKCSVNVTSSWK